MSYYTYRGLLSKIGRQLSQHDHQQLLETCGLDDEANNIPDARSLLKRLEGKNHLGIDRLGVLKVVLRNFKEFTMLGELMEFEEERKECKNFLAKISDALDSDERNHLEQLKDICRRRQTSLELDESISNIRTLFEELEKHESLDFCALDFLKEILAEIKKEDLLKEIEEYEQRRNKNHTAEIRKAKFYSLGKVVTDKVAQVLNMKTVFGVAAAGITLLTVREILTRWSTYDQLVTSFQGCVLPAGSRLIEVSRGCVCFTIQVDNLTGLTALWNMYEDGTLRERLFNFFVTDEMKTRAGGEENVELTVTIEKAEYEKAYFELVQEADGNQKRPLERGVRRHSDSVLSLPPRTDGNSLKTITQLKNQVKSLEERIEAVETQMVSFEKGPAKVPGRKCEHSDSVISTTPNEDETLQVKVKRLENDFQLLKERVENQETQTTRLPLEFLETRMGTEIIPTEEVQNACYERLGDKPRGFDEHKWNFTKMYVESLQFETKSLMSEASDSAIGTEGAPSEFDVDIGDKRDTQTVAGDDWNSLSSAVQTGNFAIIENMLSRGLDINIKNNDGNTALILAVSSGKMDAVNYLLEKGADPFIVGHSGITPLHAASKDDNVNIIETLKSRGLEIDIKDNRGVTPLMFAAAYGKIEAVNYLLDNGADPYIRDQLGKNSLHIASGSGNVAIFETLMSRGLEIDIKDNEGDTPLMLAARFGKIEAVNYLLDKGANPHIRDQFGRSSLHMASEGGNVAIIETLMSRGLEIDIKDNIGATPLMWAAACGKIEAVNYLLYKGADPYIRDKSGRNSLHAAAHGGNVAIVTKMLSLGLDVNSKDVRGHTPLKIAKTFGKTEALTFLFNKGGH